MQTIAPRRGSESKPRTRSARRGALAGLLAAAVVGGLGCHEIHFNPDVETGEIAIYDDLFAVSTPSADHIVAAGYWGAVYVSTDAGATWQKGGTGTRGLLYDVSMADDKRGWAVGQLGLILRTEDGGLTWTRQQTNKAEQGTHLFGVQALDPNTAWAVGDWGTRIYTRDGGETWRDASLTIDELHPQFVWLSPPEQDRVRRGEKVYEDVGLTDVFCLRAPSQRCWIIGEFGYIFYSNDAGESWNRSEIAGSISVDPIELAYNTIDIAPSDAAELKRFANEIKSFPHLNVGISPVASRAEIEALGGAEDPGELFDVLEARTQAVSAVLESAGLLSDRIRKRGAPPWDYEDFLADDPEFLNRYIASRLAETPGIMVEVVQNPYLFSVRFEDDRNGYIAGLGGVVLVSKDGGQSWAYRETGRKQAIFSVYPVAGQVIAVGEKGFVRVSNDGGDSWNIPESGFPNIFTFMRDIYFDPTGAHGYIVGERGMVLRSTDAGRNWARVLPPSDAERSAGG